MGRLLYWSEHTAGVVADTGIQRVVRNVARELVAADVDLVPVGWDAAARRMRLLSTREQARIVPRPVASEIGFARNGDWLLVPEIPARILADGLDPIRLAAAYGLRTAAIVHDVIPLNHPEIYPPEMVSFYARYFAMFAEADLVIATTHHVALRLQAHVGPLRRILVVPLAAEIVGVPRGQNRRSSNNTNRLDLLTVSRFEPRKNLPRLLRAIAAARDASGKDIRLSIVGRRGGFPDYEAEVDALLRDMPWVREHDNIEDAALVRLYRSHTASIFPSWSEGFGLPVLESLWMGTPALCHNASAMAEVAPGGGTLMIDMLDELAIAATLVRLASEPGVLADLASAASRRRCAHGRRSRAILRLRSTCRYQPIRRRGAVSPDRPGRRQNAGDCGHRAWRHRAPGRQRR